MPQVIYVPPDPRVEAYGKAFESAAGDFGEAIQQRRLNEAYKEAQQTGDPTQLMGMGKAGRELATAMVTGRLRERQIQKTEAETKETRLRTELMPKEFDIKNLKATQDTIKFQLDVENKNLEIVKNQLAISKDPLERQNLQSQITERQLKINQLQSANTSLDSMQAAYNQAQGLTGSQPGGGTTQPKVDGVPATAGDARTGQAPSAPATTGAPAAISAVAPTAVPTPAPTTPGDPNVPEATKDRPLPDPKPNELGTKQDASAMAKEIATWSIDQQARLDVALKSKDPKEVIKTVKAIEDENREKPLPDKTIDMIGDSAAFIENIRSITDNLDRVDTGNLKGKLLDVFNKYGFNPALLGYDATDAQKAAIFTEQEQLALRNNVMASRGFLSQVAVSLNKHILPNPLKTKLVNLASAQVFLTNMITKMKSIRDSYTGDRKNLKGLDDLVTKAQENIDRINKFQFDEKSGQVFNVAAIEDAVPETGLTGSSSGRTITRANVLNYMHTHPKESIESSISSMMHWMPTKGGMEGGHE